MNENKATPKPKKHLRALRLFFFSLIFVTIAALVAVVGYSYVGNRMFTETFYSVSSLKVHNKIRIIQISDLHDCRYGEGNAKLIHRVEKLNPDLILYTGDCIDSLSRDTSNVVNLCKALADVAPSYYIYGNNEVDAYYGIPMTQTALDAKYDFTDENRDPQKLLEQTDVLSDALEKAGVRVLKNQTDTITVGATTIDILGILTSNPSSFWSYAGAIHDEFLYTNESNLKITAIHEPLVFEDATPPGWGDLLVAGHTHGGTAKIPMLGPVYTHDGGVFPGRGGHFVYGRYDVLGTPLIVSSGLENQIFWRINNPPELVIIDINKF